MGILAFYIWFVFFSFSPKIPRENDPIIFYSNQCRQDLRITLLKAIEKARNSIHLVMFGISDPSILRALEKKAQDSLVLKIFYDIRSSPFLDLPAKTIFPIKSSGLVHQKVLVIDHKISFVGSANCTTSSLSMHDNLIIGFHHKELAEFLEQKTPFSRGYFHTTIQDQELEGWLLPDWSAKALQSLRSHLQAAKKTISLAMFTITHPLLVDELIEAYKRDVHVEVFIDLHSALGCSAPSVQKLQRTGIEVHLSQGPQLMHHKYVYIDQKTLIFGSTNWTKAAFTKNRDCFFILNNLTNSQIKFMNKLNKIISLESN
ncbi:MAG: hypothetical protein JW769_02310 [Parachlamydiales bacterium]|nr:hypothetical protein [Parachlamydiales bacterium]